MMVKQATPRVLSLPKRRHLARAISAIIAGGTTFAAWGQDRSTQGSQVSTIEEVVVTARKRTENLQDIPEAVMAFSTADIERAGFKGMDDYARFVPSMTVVGTGPGQNKIVFRGLADSVRPYIADSTAGIYLDEQPLTTGAQSPEVRPIDIERIEALSGPQGTLYGASSQSGTLRIITNKPRADEFEANMGVDGNTFDGGGDGWDVDGVVNIPVIKDTLAIRLVGFAARDGGYIDNVLGTDYLTGTLNNANVAEDNHNDGDWLGARAQVKWWVNQDWSVLAGINYQKSNIHGFNDYDPVVGDLKVVNFFDEKWDDEWFQVGGTIEGQIGVIKVLSATNYFERDTSYTRDATAYASYLNFYSAYNDFTANPYYASYNTYDFSPVGAGFRPNPRAKWFQVQKDERISQEIRASYDGSRWDWTMGFFYQYAEQDWNYEIIHPGWRNTDAFRAQNFLHGGNLAPTDVRWNSSEYNSRRDIAFFGEASFEIIPKVNLIAGGRWYDAKITRRYFVAQPETAPRDVTNPSGSDSGFLPKGGVQWFWGDDKMFYATFSEGFRTGGINRGRGQSPTLPVQYSGDTLFNYEAGVKTQWLDGRLQANITGYHQVWKDIQLELTDPSFLFGEPFQTVVANVGDGIVDGIDFDFTAVPIEGLEMNVNGTWLLRAETDQPLVVFDPRLPGQPTLDIPAGQRLPLVADLNLSASLQYTWPMAMLGGDAYVRFQYSYTGDSFNKLVDDPEPYPRIVQADYQIGDLKVGLTRETWEMQLYINNIWDERAEIFRDTDTFDRYFGHDNIRTNRPRQFGIHFRKYF